MTEEQDSYFTKGSIIIFLTFLGGFIASYLLNVALAQTLGPMEYGDYKVAEAFISLGGIIVLMGGGNAVARFLPKQINGNREGVWDYTRFYSCVIIAVTVLLVCLVVIGHELHAFFNEENEYYPILLACLAIPFVAFTALLGGILQVAKRLDLAFIPWRVGYPGARLIIGALYFLLIGSISLYDAVLITVLATILVSGYSLYKVRHLSLMPIKPVDNFIAPIRWLKVSFPMMMIIVLNALSKQLDIYMLEYMVGEVAVGHFSAAQTSANAILSMQLAIFALITPLIIPALELGKQAVAEINAKAFKIILMVVLPLSALLIYFAEPVLTLFGHETDCTYMTLIILVIGYASNCILGLSNVLLQYTGKEKTVTFIMVSSVSLNAVLNLLLIPVLEVEGAALATAIAMFYSAFVTGWVMYRHLGILPWSKIKREPDGELLSSD